MWGARCVRCLTKCNAITGSTVIPACAGVGLKRCARTPDALLVSRRSKQLVLVTVVILAGFGVRSIASESTRFPAVPEPRIGLSCYRQGGAHDYCECLDRLEAARAVTGRSGSKLPPLEHPTIRFAMRHPRRYPIINADTLRCVTPPVPHAPGVFAGVTAGLVVQARDVRAWGPRRLRVHEPLPVRV